MNTFWNFNTALFSFLITHWYKIFDSYEKTFLVARWLMEGLFCIVFSTAEGKNVFVQANDSLLPSALPFIVEITLLTHGLHHWLEPGILEPGCLSVTHTDFSAQLGSIRTHVHMRALATTHQTYSMDVNKTLPVLECSGRISLAETLDLCWVSLQSHPTDPQMKI